MEAPQLTAKVDWLDEERRLDKMEIAKLRQVTDNQTQELQEQTRRIQELEGQLTALKATMSRSPLYDQALEQLKNEVVLLIEQYEERRKQAEQDASRARQIDRDAELRALNEIKKDLQKLYRHEDELQLRKAEDQRLNDLALRLQQDIVNIGKDIDQRIRTLGFLEEQQRIDSKRMAELQQTSTHLLTTAKTQSSKQQSLEEASRRHEQQLAHVLKIRSQLEQERTRLMESLRLTDDQRKKQMAEWSAEAEAQRKRMDDYALQMQRAAEQYERNKRSLAALEQLREQVKKERTEIAELQRLAEERQKRDWEEWQAENERRWKKETLRWEHQRDEQVSWNEETELRLTELEELSRGNQAQIKALQQMLEAYSRQQISIFQKCISDLETRAREGR